MLPVIALVGRPNVGKSTLFNALTRTRDALVADQPGLTRDRRYGFGRVGVRPFLAVDTGGLSGVEGGIDELMALQTGLALEEADRVFFLVEARDGLTAVDERVADTLRRLGKPCRVVVNKTEGMDPDIAVAEFHALGFGDPVAISAAHGINVSALIEAELSALPIEANSQNGDTDRIRVAIVGRPNVGKSTLINRFVGEERVLAFDEPGTTRDSVFVPFDRDGRRYTLIDTAGVRRKSRVHERIEKFSIIKTLQAVDTAQVVVVMLDARQGIGEQDASLLGLILHRGRAVTIAVNKWDGLSRDTKEEVRRHLAVKLPFMDFASLHFISALHGTGITKVLESVNVCYQAAHKDIASAALTEMLAKAVAAHPPPASRGRRPKLRYAHQGGRNPQRIVIHGSQTDRVAPSYKRYLINTFRKGFRLKGAPIELVLKTGKNPYAGRHNRLTARQMAKRKRLMRHVKKK